MSKSGKTVSSVYSATKILVDYFCFSIGLESFCNFEDDNKLHLGERLKSKLFLDNLPWQERRGMYGYESACYYDGIVLAWGGNDSVYCQMSGTGCRTWESLHPGLTWERFILYLQATYPSWHCSRLDIACDTFHLLDLSKIQQYTRKEKYISRWKTYLIQEGSVEQSVIWGSAKSDFRCRIYDKTLERMVKSGAKPEDIPSDWVRVEFQLRNQAAASFLRSWQKSGSIGSTFLGILKNQLLYCSRYDGKNRDRAVVASWWGKLLGDAEQVKMSYAAGKEYNFQSLSHYLFHQVGASLRTYLTITDGDLGELMDNIRASRLNTRQKELIETAGPARQERLRQAIHRQEAFDRQIQNSIEKVQEGNYGEALDFRGPAIDRGDDQGTYEAWRDSSTDWV